ncbi:MAG: hypothetical protein KDD66_15600 [Bdellovibrionales bacterium]|nr:hypothetical protein [Bdellovibrionales bacterium]
MKRTVKRLLIFSALLAVFTFVRFPYETLLEDELAVLKRQAASQGLFFDLEQTSLRFPGKLSFGRFGALFATRNMPVPLVLTDGELELDFLPFILLQTQVSGEAQAYDGTIEAEFTRGIFGGPYSAELHGNSLSLDKHPSLQSLGLSGLADLEIDAAADSGEPLESLNAELKLHSAALNYPGQIAGAFKIPSLSNIDADIAVAGEDGRFAIQRCTASTSHGNLSCKGSFSTSPQGALDTAGITIELALNDAGRTEFGPYLALAGGRQNSPTGGAYTINIQAQRGIITKFAVTPG